MGYYTSHKLKIIEGDDFITDYKAEAGKIYDGNPFKEACTWYKHEDDMRELSRKYPNTLFELSGEGEENSDMWVEYYLGGKMQRIKAVITYEPFDKNKLE